jgi:hypothetical protein
VTCACAPPQTSICPCDDDGRCPRTVANPGGLDAIAYRVGDFVSFRHALVRHAPGEVALAGWQPTTQTDLGLQVVDWWAYVADVLTFYSERIANEAYLGTATLPESVRRLVAALGYRPRPGIGAKATLAALATGPRPLALPAGFAIASKPAPGIDPQTFELGAPVTFASPSSVEGAAPENPGSVPGDDAPPAGAPAGAAVPAPHTALLVRGGVLVKGKPAVAVGDRLLLIGPKWPSNTEPPVLVTVTGTVVERDPHRRSNTRVLLSGAESLAGAKAAGYRLLRATHTNHLTTLPEGAPALESAGLVLDGTARHLRVGDPLLVMLPNPGTGTAPGKRFSVVRLIGYDEVIWYANAPTASAPQTPPDKNAIALLLARLSVEVEYASQWLSPKFDAKTAVSVCSGWVAVGKLLDTPVRRASTLPSKVVLARPPAAPAGQATPALVEDARGRGTRVAATPTAGGSEVALAPAAGTEAAPLEPPLRLLWDLLDVTRGKTVRDEPLVTPVATLPGEDFKLSRSPVTYLADAASRSGEGYSSTVEVVVDGVRWTEVQRFFGRGPKERIFVTREDDEGATHVLFGDGANGARLPATARASASYRVGSGATVPPVGTLTQILDPAPNLAAVRNPVLAYGGADPDAPEQVRELAPRSVLTFGRAVSGADYAAVAAQAPGVTRAAAEWAWDPGQQRSMVRVHVGDDAGAVAAARVALRQQSDPNRPVAVVPAQKCRTELLVTLVVDPAYLVADVIAAARAALMGELFTPAALGLGETLYRSRIEATCDLPGVMAVHKMRMFWISPGDWHDSTGPRFSPGPGGWFDLQPENLILTAQAAADG